MKTFLIFSALIAFLAGAVSVIAGPLNQAPPSYFKSYAGLVWNPQDHYWLRAQKEVERSVLSIVVQDQQELDHGIRYHKLIRGAPQLKEVALTFDDGPHPAYTPQILAILQAYNVKATFFVVGERAEQYPELIRDEAAGGHEIGNHTYHHVNLTKVTPAEAETEIKACGEVVRAITGKSPHLFRPPGGDYSSQTAVEAEALGYTTVLWTDDPGDFKHPGDQVIMDRTIDHLCPGAVILLHDGIHQTIDILPSLIEQIRAKGYRIVTVDQLIRDSANLRLERTPAASPKMAARVKPMPAAGD